MLDKCKELQRNNQLHTENIVQQLYKTFTPEDISDKIAQLITASDINIPVSVIYQTIESLHEACPTNLGDWYFTGKYPNTWWQPCLQQSLHELYGRKKCKRVLKFCVRGYQLFCVEEPIII